MNITPHEPFNTILSFIGLMKEELDDNATNDFSDYFDSIRSAGARISRTIDMILNLAEIQSGTYESRFMEFDIHEEVIKFLVLEYETTAKRNNLKLKITADTENTFIYAVAI